MDGIDFVIAAEQIIPETKAAPFWGQTARRVLAALLVAVDAKQPKNLVADTKAILSEGPAAVGAAIAGADSEAATFMDGGTGNVLLPIIWYHIDHVESLEP